MGLWEGLCQYEGVDTDIEEFRDARIQFYMTKAIATQAHAAGVGQRLRTAVEDYRSVDERLLSELGRNPTLEELAEALHMTVEEAALAGQILEQARAMNRVLKPQEEELPQEEDQAVEDTAYFQMRQRIAELLSGLSEADAKLLTLRYGLEGGNPLTPQQVAEKLGIPVSEIAAKEAQILAQLRQQKD
jgi:DNA-directed RNA polymerase sigma subunit (sigma70/sigma32)